MADGNFDNGFEKVPAAGEFYAGAGGLHVEELRGPTMASGAETKESGQTSKTEKASCKLDVLVNHIFEHMCHFVFKRFCVECCARALIKCEVRKCEIEPRIKCEIKC